MAILEGKKTYVAAALTIIGAVAAYLVGDANLNDTIGLCVPALLIILFRKGTADETKQVIAEVTQVKHETAQAVENAIPQAIQTAVTNSDVVTADQLRSIVNQPTQTTRKR